MIFFVLLLRAISSASLFIDLGSESMRVSFLQRGSPVQIVHNSIGKRFTPAVAALIPTTEDAPVIITSEDVNCFQRLTGDSSIITRYPSKAIRFLPQLLGKNYSSKLISYFAKRNLTMPFDCDEDKYLDLTAPPEFYASQLISLAIDDYSKSKPNATVDSVSLVIPKFLTHHQRAAFSRAAKLSTYKPHLIETTSAVGTLFAVERGQLFKNNTLMVCFIDIGASQMQVSVQEFNYEKDGPVVQELGYSWTDTFGSYSVDVKIAEEIRREVLKQNPKIEIDEKSVQKIIAAGRKVKHELTLQPNVTLYLEDLVHGLDMTFTFSLEKLKSICKNELKVLNKTFFEAFHQAGFDVYEDIDRFELIGGGTRSPLFIDFINNIFNGKVPVMRSLNTEEANVIGAGYFEASRLGSYLTSPIKFEGLPLYNISLIKDEKYATFKYQSKQKLPLGIKPYIRTIGLLDQGTYEIIEGQVKVTGYHKFSKSGLYKSKRSSTEKIIRSFEEKEQKQRQQDSILHDFESFLIDSREKISFEPSIIETSTPEEREKVLKLIASIQYKVTNEKITNENELKQFRYEIESASHDLIKRGKDKEEAPEAFERLEELLDDVNDAVEKHWPKMGMKPPKKLLRRLGRECQKADDYIEEHKNGNDLVLDDILILFERLKNAYENVKANLKPKNVEL
ncbi:dnaK protein [Histomonas meleagridis]|uniref:dnaK protein n=1 Tax=Histomonas meleagridis TaxID=135588 RepID=UPI00355A24C1|nr:dnaK protein [Histomonas meleagridis]KAH0799602.1 dnaK protein [Histomonas meleagridis]